MTTIALESIVGRADGFSTAAVQDELMMLNVEQGAYYSLDPIAADIWRLLEKPARVEDLTNELVQRYAVTPEQCRADVLGFLEQMLANGMITVR